MVVNKDGLIEKKGQAGFLYTNDVCLMPSNEQDLQIIFNNISEYGMKVIGLYKWSEEREEMEF